MKKLVRAGAIVVSVGTCFAALGVSAAVARPGIGAAARLPIAGGMVDLGCANPANIGLTGKVLAAADPKVGGQLRCFARAISPQGRSGRRSWPAPPASGRRRSSRRTSWPD